MQLKDFHYMVNAFRGDSDLSISHGWISVSNSYQMTKLWELYKTCWEDLGSLPWTSEIQNAVGQLYEERKMKVTKPNRRVLNT